MTASRVLRLRALSASPVTFLVPSHPGTRIDASSRRSCTWNRCRRLPRTTSTTSHRSSRRAISGRDDHALREAVAREGGGDFVDVLAGYGSLAGDELYRLSFDAHRDRPRLRTHDRFGHRIDLVEFHPNYHRIMQAAIEHGVAGLSWSQPRTGAHVARAALSYLHHQVEPASSCPLTMTHAAIPVLRHEPALAEWATKAAAAALRPARYRHRAQARRHHRHGHDREARRQRRARQHDRRHAAGRRRRVPRWSATSGSSRRRCPTASWCWRRRRAG